MSVATSTDADICPTCGSTNGCAVVRGDATCWCFALPKVLRVSETEMLGRCFCRTCLERVIGDRATRTKSSP
jgi:cysteine-rich CWC protein